MRPDPNSNTACGPQNREGLAVTPRGTVTGGVQAQDGPMDRAGTEADAEAGMTNEPIPMGDDEPEVALNRRPDDL
ncbi:hypothetical protein [Methylobacterium persicinum]|uniref:Uncharacterized protein n=1 Tax=Methylobacterium persicinum TaxID=374426 RepID=A0ABU0HIK2_9HYPH|nr:hypothetical protein [Methylobacterium persicinum]MDQ0441777.1 hypothetical protein [Methylobacterium persicinum]GJE37962.1 hypothetical protein KHHGKMAE_2027 [Methylobacterium persicinum]